MSGIFISYRRDDSSGWAGRLYEHLVRDWGPDRVFMDIDAIAPGEDFREAINRTMDTCDVVMVVIGPHWIGAVDKQGNRRLDDTGDNHRQEVIAALATHDVRVIPVLVGGATMPTVGELPDALHDLAFRNAAVVDDRRFSSDVRALQASIRDLNPNAADTDATGASYSYTPPPPGSAAGGPTAASASGGPGSASSPPATPASSTGTSTSSLVDVVPMALAVIGAAIVLFAGVLDPHDWHDENTVTRVFWSLVVVVAVAAGLLTKKWSWILIGGIAGLGGFCLWLVQMVDDGGHTLSELFSTQEDGTVNLLMFAGAAMVVVAGAIGVTRRRT